MREHFCGYSQGVASGLALRHDNGSQYSSHYFQSELSFLGIKSSPAYVREPEGNGVAERFIKTLKEQLLWVQRFGTMDDLQQALQSCKQQYNQRWLVSKHGYVAPRQARAAHAGAGGMTRLSTIDAVPVSREPGPLQYPGLGFLGQAIAFNRRCGR
ncbi:MAG: integrase core domain-containing protein [Candidatus Dormibacteria bacterium]